MFKRKQNRIVVYVAISGSKDKLIEPAVKPRGYDMVAFLDYGDTPSEHYRTFTVISQFHAPVMKAKRYKILPHQFFADHEISVYVDGNLEIVGDIEELVETYLGDANMAVFKHPDGRSCVYEEAEACIKLGKGDPDRIKQQIERYREAKHPEKAGLVACAVLIRRHKEFNVRWTMEGWWNEILAGSVRDQLSFPVVALKEKLRYTVIGEDFRDCEWFKWRPHQTKEAQ